MFLHYILACESFSSYMIRFNKETRGCYKGCYIDVDHLKKISHTTVTFQPIFDTHYCAKYCKYYNVLQKLIIWQTLCCLTIEVQFRNELYKKYIVFRFEEGHDSQRTACVTETSTVPILMEVKRLYHQ